MIEKKNLHAIDIILFRSGFRIVGDVEYEAANKKASYITPVPGKFIECLA